MSLLKSQVTKKIKQALEAPPEMDKRAHQRIVEYFLLEKRTKKSEK